MIKPQGWKGLIIQYCNMRGYIMVIWAVVTSCISITGAQWSCRGGEAPPQVKNPWEYHLKFKNQCHLQYDTTKIYQFLRLFTIIKLLILIQSFYFTHILHSSESLVYNRFYIVYDYNHYNIEYNQCSIYFGTKFLSDTDISLSL